MSGKVDIVFPNDGVIPKDHKDKISEFLQKKAPLPRKCPTCGQRRWSILEDYVNIPVFYPRNSTVYDGKVYPGIGLVCVNCGNMQLVNAMAILKGEEKNDGEGADE